MLSSRPNEYGKQFLVRTFGISSALHVALILLFFGVENWFSQGPVKLSLKHAGSRVRMISTRPGGVQGSGLIQQAPLPEQKASVPEKVAPKVDKRSSKKKDKNNVPSLVTPKSKKEPAKKGLIPSKKEKNNKDLSKKSKEIPSKKESLTKKESSKKSELKKEDIKEDSSKKNSDDVVPTTIKRGTLNQQSSSVPLTTGGVEGGVDQEVNAAEAVWSPDEMVREFGRHFTIPEGFEDFEPFEMTFDTDSEGNVVNISRHLKGPLVVYTAVKDAFLKSAMPQKNRKNIIWLIS